MEPERNGAISHVWDEFIGPDDAQIYKKAGFGHRSGIGQRPALLIVDVQYRTTGTRDEPILQAMDEFPTACGRFGWDAVRAIVPLLELFRGKGWPVVYPHVSPKSGYDSGRLGDKVPAIMGIPPQGYNFVAEVAPRANDILIPKKHPSAFFGTPLVSYLIAAGVDTLIVTGCTTSGCIRGTVVDAFANNYHVIVPAECVYDRGRASHAINLFDMNEKYADVMPVALVMERLRKLAGHVSAEVSDRRSIAAG